MTSHPCYCVSRGSIYGCCDICQVVKMGDICVCSQWCRRWLNSLWWYSNLGYLRPCLGFAACCLSSGLRSLVSGTLYLMPTANSTSVQKGTQPGIWGSLSLLAFLRSASQRINLSILKDTCLGESELMDGSIPGLGWISAEAYSKQSFNLTASWS